MHPRTRMKTFAFLMVALSFVAAACTSSTGGGACMTDADCGAAQVCGFAEGDACSAQGRCFPAPGAVCQAYSPGCACDGTAVNVACTGLPQGYVSKPLAHTGACGDACAAAYPCLSTISCAADADCAELGSKCDPCMKLCGCGVPDAGACCPPAWTLYACTYPDGGAGQACHNPELGCASSLTCGEGCDPIVDGVCGGG